MWFLQREPESRNRCWLFTAGGCDPFLVIVWLSLAVALLLPLMQQIRQFVMRGL